MNATFVTAGEVLRPHFADLRAGEPPVFFTVGQGEFERLEVGPGLVTVIGAPPAAGKTAIVNQWAFDAPRLNPDLKVLIANVEMSPAVLLDRQIARIAGLRLEWVRYRRIGRDRRDLLDRLDFAEREFTQFADRVAFAAPPFTLPAVIRAGQEFDADLIVLDYIQRFGTGVEHRDSRGAIDTAMGQVRAIADRGRAVIVVSAVGRHKNKDGNNSYAGLGLASFRGSSELEFGADDAFVLERDGRDRHVVTLKHVKSRHGEPKDLILRFDGAHQSFIAQPAPAEGPLRTDASRSLLNRLGRTEPHAHPTEPPGAPDAPAGRTDELGVDPVRHHPEPGGDLGLDSGAAPPFAGG